MSIRSSTAIAFLSFIPFTALAAEATELNHEAISVATKTTIKQNFISTGAALIDGTLRGNCVVFGSSVTIRGTAQGDVVSVGGALEVLGKVEGTVIVVGGRARIAGAVSEDIQSLGGEVILEPQSAVKGKVRILGGRLIQRSHSNVQGGISAPDVSLAKFLVPLSPRLGQISTISGKLTFKQKFAQLLKMMAFLVGLGLVTVLLAFFFGTQVETVAFTMRANLIKSGSLGGLLAVLIIPALILMLFSLIGIPLVPIALLISIAAVFLGITALSLATANLYVRILKRQPSSTVRMTALGYGLTFCLMMAGELLSLADFLDQVGTTLIIANASVLTFGLILAIGAIAITRLGTTEVSQSL